MPDSSSSINNQSHVFPTNIRSTKPYTFKPVLKNTGSNLLGALWNVTASLNIIKPYNLEQPLPISIFLEERVSRRISLRQAYNIALQNSNEYEANWKSYLKNEMKGLLIDKE